MNKWENLKKEQHDKQKKNNPVIPIADKLKKKDKARALLATAIMEDEVVRIASEKNSKEYLRRIEESDKTPFWMWCLLYFILGILTAITIDNISFNINELAIYFQEFFK